MSAALLIAAPAAAQTAAQGETPSAEPPPIPVTIASPAQSSESPERIALARQLLEASGFRDQMRAGHDMAALLLSMMLPSILSQQSNGTDRLAEIERNFPGGISAFSERYVAHFRDRLDHYHPEIIERVATFYAERMTREQLEATLVFLETDSGKAWSGAVTGYVQLAATVTAEYDTLAGNEALDLITAELRAASTQTEEE